MRGEGARPAEPDLSYETAWRARGARLIAGVDEAGRGPLAGPVVAAAVVLDERAVPDGIRDSKELTPAAREELYVAITATARVGVAIGPVTRIDRDNILQATLWAMRQAVRALGFAPCAVLVDGNQHPRLRGSVETIVGGDGRSLSIAAASIVAKVTRDRLMDRLARAHPQYGFDRHRGYATPEHLEALRRHGACRHHRRSFAPVAAVLGRG